MTLKNVKINVAVDVEKLYNGGAIDECCSLSDDNGGKTPTGNPEQFESKVYAGKNVIWVPVASGGDVSAYDLSLSSIDYESGSNILGEKSIPADGEGKVTGTVLESAKKGEKEKYIIKFTITLKGGETKPFTIDPEMDVDNDD